MENNNINHKLINKFLSKAGGFFLFGLIPIFLIFLIFYFDKESFIILKLNEISFHDKGSISSEYILISEIAVSYTLVSTPLLSIILFILWGKYFVMNKTKITTYELLKLISLYGVVFVVFVFFGYFYRNDLIDNTFWNIFGENYFLLLIYYVMYFFTYYVIFIMLVIIWFYFPLHYLRYKSVI
ncbi:hypothetical protein [Photorhabdus aegyptia]|uniref:Colicin immunity protein n=1 Tax=Photorhabdus aegyptia TaxID=2805098 RepID=A0A022PGN9_9GAMM|nr:hypothetical protein [Photorhabdus aegyptia]EYU14103.1 hypothetical protein BA1DRAFT_03407 [Photorhabdus aegyptia]